MSKWEIRKLVRSLGSLGGQIFSLKQQIADKDATLLALSERCHGQSELLSGRAGKPQPDAKSDREKLLKSELVRWMWYMGMEEYAWFIKEKIARGMTISEAIQSAMEEVANGG